MSWSKRLFGQEVQETRPRDQDPSSDPMGPGLTGEYDWELREKAGLHQPPPLPENMGLEGEFDPQGLAKRVAAALDCHPHLEDIPSLEIQQQGSRIILRGWVPSQAVLKEVVAIAAKVDGTTAVDFDQVLLQSAGEVGD